MSAHKVLLSQEDRLAIFNICGVWCFENRDNDMLILDISHLVEHERNEEDDESLHQDALKAGILLDKVPSLVGWRKALNLLQIGIK